MTSKIECKRILSFGAGVQTTAMVLLYPERYDYVVFADTGDEKIETMQYLYQHMQPYFEKKGIKFVTVKNSKWDSLYQYCIVKQIIPTRDQRWCTDRFKQVPIRKFVRGLGASKKNPWRQDLGISFDEIHRMNPMYDVTFLKSDYPLCDNKITRDDCKKIILEYGFPVPPKSGCFYCPFAKNEEFRQLKLKEPERFQQVIYLEKNGKRYPELILRNKPMEKMQFSQELDSFMGDDTCDSGACFR